MFLGVGPCRAHHLKVHDMSLVDVPVKEGEDYLHTRCAQFDNLSRLSAHDRKLVERHPPYHATDD